MDPYPANVKGQLIRNSIRTPDGTEIISRHRHDYQSHKDANGHTYAVDGGLGYLRRGGPADFTDTSVRLGDDLPQQEAVKIAEWGTYGKDGKQPLKWIPIAEMDIDHLKAVIQQPVQLPAFAYLMGWEMLRRTAEEFNQYGRLVYFICGKPRHGKDTFGDFLAEATGLKKGSTSDIIYESLAAARGISVEELKALPKEELRPELIREGNELCAERPSYLADTLIERGCSIIVGVRRCVELEARVSACTAGLVWIDRPDGPDIEDNTEPELEAMANVILSFGENDFDAMRSAAKNLADILFRMGKFG